MSDPARTTFRSAIIRAYTVRSHVNCGLYRQALIECEALRRELSSIPDAPPVVHGADPKAAADALVGHAEAGSPFGMLLMCEELLSLVCRITADADEMREQGVRT
jgi:hypothetical protein